MTADVSETTRRPIFAMGTKLVLVACGDGERYPLSETMQTDKLMLVEITINDERESKGEWGGGTHLGYKAIGSDGKVYTCQWNRFDDASMNPYANWHGEGPDFSLLWEIHNVMPYWSFDKQKLVADRINALFPDSALAYCDAPSTRDPSRTHRMWHYVREGCAYCECGF